MTAQDLSLASAEAVPPETGHFLVAVSITPFIPWSPLLLIIPRAYDKCKEQLISRERQPSNADSMKGKWKKKSQQKRVHIPAWKSILISSFLSGVVNILWDHTECSSSDIFLNNVMCSKVSEKGEEEGNRLVYTKKKSIWNQAFSRLTGPDSRAPTFCRVNTYQWNSAQE